MRVERFSYELPQELIAQAPAPRREAARLMVVPESGPLAHATIADLPSLLPERCLLVVNDTRVLKARIVGTKEGTGGRAEIFLLEDLGGATYRAMGRASKGLKEGARVLKGPLVVTVNGRDGDGIFRVSLSTTDGSTVDEAIRAVGQVPLPPYIRRDPGADDEERYQTVFAEKDGAVAAPTAGLHLSRELLDRLADKGCEIAACTLHVGLGTFQPVTVEDLDDHPMHAERFEVSPALASAVERARERGAPVVAVGTTVVRALESARDPERPDRIRPCAGATRLLIQPGHAFGVVDRLLTNFHLPRSTLLALVCAFAGIDRVLAAYRVAVEQRYRFFSYGDAMLLTRAS